MNSSVKMHMGYFHDGLTMMNAVIHSQDIGGFAGPGEQVGGCNPRYIERVLVLWRSGWVSSDYILPRGGTHSTAVVHYYSKF